MHPKACWRLFGLGSSSTRSFANNRRCTVQSSIFTPPQGSFNCSIHANKDRIGRLKESSFLMVPYRAANSNSLNSLFFAEFEHELNFGKSRLSFGLILNLTKVA